MTAHLRGKVQTVLGIKDPHELGVILPHEHLMLNFQDAVMKPNYGPDNLAELSYEMKNLGKIRQFPYSVKGNLVIKEEDVIEELKLFKKAGGGCVCDLTSIGIRLNTHNLPQVSRDSGVDIVVGTSYYVDAFIPGEAKLKSIEEMAEVHINEIELGIGRSGVKCGVIGEVGCSSPLTDNEIKSLRAAAMAQQKTGAPLIIHPGREERAPFEILDVLEAAGADLSHTAMSHLDRTIFDDGVLLEFAKRGCYLEFDLFGMECSNYQWLSTIDMPSDAQRIKKVKLLVDNGYTHQVLLSHDIHTKHRLVNYGGHGYRHILEHIVPKMADRGITKEVVQKIITDNPQQWLAFR